MPQRRGGSTLVLDEHYENEDSRFLQHLETVDAPKKLAGLAERWKKDPRPWARARMLEWLGGAISRVGHEPLVKRLFKQAEARGDDELMVGFLVCFDRLVRRKRWKGWRWDWESGRMFDEERLITPRDRVLPERQVEGRDPWTGEKIQVVLRERRTGKLFRYRTRYYLRRRVWRYFRRLGRRQPERYRAAMIAALARYEDADFAAGETILDNWSALHACFAESDVLSKDVSRWSVAEGRTIGELTPAPYLPEVWRGDAGFDALLELVTRAKAHFVRRWALQLLRQEHATAFAGLAPDRLVALFDSEAADVRELAAELFAAASGLEELPLASWLKLVTVDDPAALSIIADRMRACVRADRLSLDQTIDLTCAQPAQVAELGFAFLEERTLAADDRKQLSRLAEARCDAIGAELARWALGEIEVDGYDREAALAFFDGLNRGCREGAWAWLEAEGSPGRDDAPLWAKLFETPYGDLHLRLVDALERRLGLRGRSPDGIARLWTTVLLGIHRGSRQKPRAISQLADAVAADPSRAGQLLPVLAVAVRSIRGPERRAGLAAVARLVEDAPAVTDAIMVAMPELGISPQEATR